MDTKTLCALFAALISSGVMTPAQAAEPENTLAFNVAVTTDYRFRGLTQSRFDPALQAGVDFTHASGFYLGAWASSIKWIKDAGGNSDGEIDLYGGYRGSISDIGYDVGVVRYQYPSHRLATSPNTSEVYAALTYGIVTAKYSHTLTNAFGFAQSKNSGYLEAAATFDLGSGWTLVPHVGRQRIDGTVAAVSNSQFSYTDYALTLGKDFGNGIVATVAAVGTNAPLAAYAAPGARRQGRDGLVLGLKYNF